MLPFVYDFVDNDKELEELIDIVTDAITCLSDEDKTIIGEIFYVRKTYEELAKTLKLKAKSHAWSKTKRALDRLKEHLVNNQRFMEITNGYH